MIYRTHCAVRLGDNLAHMHFLRGMAKAYPAHRFIHYAHICYVHQLAELACDMPNLQVCDLETVSDRTGDYWSMRPSYDDSVNAWKNAGRFWETHPLRNNWAEFQLVFCERLAGQMKLQSPFSKREDLLFSYPALRAYQMPAFDCLVINSPPMSGQMPGYDAGQMEMLVDELAKRMSVITTSPTRLGLPCTMNKQMTVTQIGALSRFCRYIVGVSTGPSWPTWNVFNAATAEFRLILIEAEQINLVPNTAHARNANEARRVLQVRGIL